MRPFGFHLLTAFIHLREAERALVVDQNRAVVVERLAVFCAARLQRDRMNEHVVLQLFAPGRTSLERRWKRSVRLKLDLPLLVHHIVHGAEVIPVHLTDDFHVVVVGQFDFLVSSLLARNHGELKSERNHAGVLVVVRRETNQCVLSVRAGADAEIDPVITDEYSFEAMIGRTDHAPPAENRNQRIEDVGTHVRRPLIVQGDALGRRRNPQVSSFGETKRF